MENEEGIDACENPGTSKKGTAAQHEARHENYVWGLKGNHMAQKAGLRTKTTPGARCRLQAISDMKEIYKTAANPVVLTDLKREFQSYLEANDLCQGQIPEELKVHVGSRIKLIEPKTHKGLGYAYAHQKINGRGRCAITSDLNRKLRFKSSCFESRIDDLNSRFKSKVFSIYIAEFVI